MLYQSTSVGFGYGLCAGAVSWKTYRRPPNPVRANNLRPSSHSGRLGSINPIPIGYGSRPRLRGPANPARINLAQEPLDFRREGFSPSFTLLMSAFALPIPPAALASHLHGPTERSATTPEDSNQLSVIRTDAMEAGEHPGNLPVLAPPALGDIGVDIAEIATIKRPDLRLVGRPQRHDQKTAELPASTAAAGRTPLPGWRRSIWTPAVPDRPAPIARSAETQGSPDAPPAIIDRPAGTRRDPRPD